MLGPMQNHAREGGTAPDFVPYHDRRHDVAGHGLSLAQLSTKGGVLRGAPPPNYLQQQTVAPHAVNEPTLLSSHLRLITQVWAKCAGISALHGKGPDHSHFRTP